MTLVIKYLIKARAPWNFNNFHVKIGQFASIFGEICALMKKCHGEKSVPGNDVEMLISFCAITSFGQYSFCMCIL